MTAEAWKQLASHKYLNIETYRKNGTAVRTPMWFAADPASGELFLGTPAGAGKVKRIRAYPGVRVAACDFRGNLRGDWIPAQASFCDPQKAKVAGKLLNRKYPMRVFFNIAAFLFRRERALIALRRAG
jgi:PPOX class probable F420-dependent enzyme